MSRNKRRLCCQRQGSKGSETAVFGLNWLSPRSDMWQLVRSRALPGPRSCNTGKLFHLTTQCTYKRKVSFNIATRYRMEEKRSRHQLWEIEASIQRKIAKNPHTLEAVTRLEKRKWDSVGVAMSKPEQWKDLHLTFLSRIVRTVWCICVSTYRLALRHICNSGHI